MLKVYISRIVLLISLFSQGVFAAPKVRGEKPICTPALGETLPYQTYEFRKIVSQRQNLAVTYRRTNRDIRNIRLYYNPQLLDIPKLVGKKVLDAGMGDGQFVLDLRQQGVDAYGLDLVLNDEQRNDQRKIFFEADMGFTPFEQHSFDGIYSTWSVFSYEQDNYKAVNRIIEEFWRILKPGGFVHIAPVRSLGMRYDLDGLNRSKAKYVYYETWRTQTEIRKSNIHTRGRLQYLLPPKTGQFKHYLQADGSDLANLFRKHGFDIAIHPEAYENSYVDAVFAARKP
jgi:SAM-dependent methyltransferase